MTYEITLKGSLCMTVTTLSKIQETLLEQRAQTSKCFLLYCSLFTPHPQKFLPKYLSVPQTLCYTAHSLVTKG